MRQGLIHHMMRTRRAVFGQEMSGRSAGVRCVWDGAVPEGRKKLFCCGCGPASDTTPQMDSQGRDTNRRVPSDLALVQNGANAARLSSKAGAKVRKG